MLLRDEGFLKVKWSQVESWKEGITIERSRRMALKQGKLSYNVHTECSCGYQVKLSHVRRKILNQMNFVVISIILVDKQLVSSLCIEF